MGVNCSSNKSPGYIVHDLRNILNFKVALIGDPSVGKTSIFQRYVKNQFVASYKPTRKPAVENVLKKVNVPDDLVASVTLWDLPGHEDVDMRDSYYRNVDAAIVVVDLMDPASISLAGSWRQDFINRSSKMYTVTEVKSDGSRAVTMEKGPCDPYSIPILLLGNKYDLVEAKKREETLKNLLSKPILDVSANLSLDDERDLHIPEENTDKQKKAPQKQVRIIDDGLQNRYDEKKPSPPTSTDGSVAEKPECVQLLEEMENKFGFVGSLPVSSRLPDGSVDTAIQALVRHLLADVRPAKLKVMKSQEEVLYKKKRKKQQTDVSRFITYCGVEEMDEIFSKCFAPIKRADDYETYYEIVLNKFRQTCLNNGFSQETRASLEDCITGLKKTLQQLGNIELQVAEDDQFVKLVYTENPDVEIADEMYETLDIFNLEYAALCKSLQKEGPILDRLLSRLQDALARMATQLKKKYGVTAEKYVHICDKNRARIAFARKQVVDTSKDIESSIVKIKTALIW